MNSLRRMVLSADSLGVVSCAPVFVSLVAAQTHPVLAPGELVAPAPAPTVSATSIRTAYLALTRESIVPANSRVIAMAALAARTSLGLLTPPGAAGKVRLLREDFGGTEIERDAAWLGEQFADLPAAWPVIEAMTRAAATAHVWLLSPQRKIGMRALASGKPISQPVSKCIRSWMGGMFLRPRQGSLCRTQRTARGGHTSQS